MQAPAAGCWLKSDRVIQDIARTGKRFSGRFVNVSYKLFDDDARQFCLKVPKRVGNAVCRNRLKRILREIIRANRESFAQGLKAVIFVKNLPAPAPMQYLSADLRKFLDGE